MSPYRNIQRFKFLLFFLSIVSSAIAKNKFRDHGEIKKVILENTPICSECHRPMGICKRLKSSLVGIHSTYTVSIPTYTCRHKNCKNHGKIRITPPNPYAAPRMTYDYSVQTEVIFIRWQEHATYKEIMERMQDRYSIFIDRTAIETILKSYELSCASSFRPTSIAKMREKGGVLICLDVVEPLKGRKGVLVAYEYWTGITLGAQRLPNGKQSTYEDFLCLLKGRIATELGLPIKGVISDALVAQRKAIEVVLPEVPHCLCHFHFYKLVLKDAHIADSAIVTTLRSNLRSLYDLREYKSRKVENTLGNSQYKPLIPFLDPLLELSLWKRKPKDPCFIGTELAHRISDICKKLQILQEKVAEDRILISKYSTRVLKRMITSLNEFLVEIELQMAQLERVHEYLASIKEILSAHDQNADVGGNSLLNYCQSLSNTSSTGDIETSFINSLRKYVETKGTLLFNYRTIQGAPTTNNFQELKFKQLKHFLRRVIGHKAAKSYFLAHGEHIVYVDPKTSRDEIEGIIKSSDQSQNRRIIRDNRRHMDAWIIVVHNKRKWVQKMNEIDLYIQQLETNPIR